MLALTALAVSAFAGCSIAPPSGSDSATDSSARENAGDVREAASGGDDTSAPSSTRSSAVMARTPSQMWTVKSFEQDSHIEFHVAGGATVPSDANATRAVLTIGCYHDDNHVHPQYREEIRLDGADFPPLSFRNETQRMVFVTAETVTAEQIDGLAPRQGGTSKWFNISSDGSLVNESDGGGHFFVYDVDEWSVWPSMYQDYDEYAHHHAYWRLSLPTRRVADDYILFPRNTLASLIDDEYVSQEIFIATPDGDLDVWEQTIRDAYDAHLLTSPEATRWEIWSAIADEMDGELIGVYSRAWQPITMCQQLYEQELNVHALPVIERHELTEEWAREQGFHYD